MISLYKKNGVALITVLIFVVLLVLIAFSIMSIAVSEMQAVKTQNNSAKAFYLAEAGIELARAQLGESWYNHTASNGSFGDGSYAYEIYDTDADGNALEPTRLRIRATGTVVSSFRTVETIVKSYIDPNSPLVIDSTVAVEAEGSIQVTGNAEVDPEGSILPQSDLDFEDVFGISKEKLEEVISAGYPFTHYYADAFNNDVATDVTWVNSPSEESQITTNGWTGSGVLIIEGDLRITGGTFNGVIWVIGALRISGNPTINGGIFVEGGVSSDTTISGTSEINYSSSNIDTASTQLANVLNLIPPRIESWKEV